MHKRYHCFICKVVLTPFVHNVPLKKNKDKSISQLKYSQMISSLLYIANRFQPDILMQLEGLVPLLVIAVRNIGMLWKEFFNIYEAL